VENSDIVWVAIGHWVFDDSEEWCVEYWDTQGAIDHDSCFATEEEAQRCAEREFGIKPTEWRDGPQPFGTPPPQ
jgi:hypothetical protein